MAKRAGFNDGEKNDNLSIAPLKLYVFFIFMLFIVMLFMRPQVVIEKFIPVGRILKNKQRHAARLSVQRLLLILIKRAAAIVICVFN